MVWAPSGLIGPGFGLPWPAGGQVGWPSQWKHLGRPDGPPAACQRRGHVRFPLVGAWGWFPQKRVPGMALVPPYRACHARFSGRKNSEGTFLESRDLRGSSASSQRRKPAIRWSSAPPPAVVIGAGWLGVLGHFTGPLLSTRTTFFAISRDMPCLLTTRRRASCLLPADVVLRSG